MSDFGQLFIVSLKRCGPYERAAIRVDNNSAEFETVRLTLQAMVVQQINCIASKQEKSLKSYRIARGYARTLKVMKIQKHFFNFLK